MWNSLIRDSVICDLDFNFRTGQDWSKKWITHIKAIDTP